MVNSGNGTKYVGLKFLNILDALESLLAITLRNVTNKIGMKKLDTILKSWKKRHLTMFGKIIVLKTLGLSQLIFSVQNTAIIENKVNESQTLI